jgi:beta-galactosidase
MSVPPAARTVRLTLWTMSAIAALIVAPCKSARAESPEQSVRSRESFNADWRFAKEDHKGAAEPTFDDSAWRKINLPHDWGIEGPFQQDLPGETAKLPYSGVGWYRKTFELPASDRGRRIFLDVDGAMSHSKVWINGNDVGGWPYGYSSWRVDLTPHLRFGAENVVAIRLDNPPNSSRWYPGGGIHRNVWLVKKKQPIHFAHWGTQIRTMAASPEEAYLEIDVTAENHSNLATQIRVSAIIDSLEGVGNSSREYVGRSSATIWIPADGSSTAKLKADISKPRLWSPEHPNLYTVRVVATVGIPPFDSETTTFGIRSIEFKSDEGFLLNGKPYEIRGVCLHHDLGALGAAFNLRARERQLKKLKELGCNAIRASHNPLEPEFYDLCDRMGFLVMDEAFDAWQMAKRDNDYHTLFDKWAERDLRAMIRRDRNHPSVIMWSLGNEVYEQRDGKNAPLAKKLAAIAHEEDPTRPVNMALHVVDASTNGFQNAVDVFGYNYTPFGYADFHRNNPRIPLIGSETSSCTSTRGEYFFPVDEAEKRSGRFNYQVTSYDYSAPKWAMAPDIEFKAQDENPFVAGEFVWTGFDYLGEPTPFDTDADEMLRFTDPALEKQADDDLRNLGKIRVPSRSSYFGIFDLCGFPKDRYYIYQARWRPDLPMAHILPHWNWPERVGQVTPVHVYTSGDEAELFLNGRSLGRQQRGPLEYRLRWNDVKYEPGELRVVAYRKGEKWATDVVKTTGPPAALTLSVDRGSLRNDGEDLAFIEVKVVDTDGNLAPRSSNLIQFAIDGPGEIVATDNGDPTSHEPFQRTDRAAFNGLALAIIRAVPGRSGAITLRADSAGLATAAVAIESGADGD